MTTAPTAPPGFRLDGRIALVTGGGTGIGLGIATALAQAGARVVIVGRRREVLDQAVADIGAGAEAMVHDVDRSDAADALVAAIDRRHGRLDILVNNAGVHCKKPVATISDAEFQQVFTTHVLGAHALIRAAVPGMVARGEGVILAIASMSALFGLPLVAAYSAAKSALVGVTRTLASELGPQGIRVNAIAPGWIDSAMMRTALAGDPARQQKILGRTPLGRFGEAADIGAAAVYLASPAARFVTGIVLPVDGGAAIGF